MISLRRRTMKYEENPNKILYYTTSNGQITTPYTTASSAWGGANIVSNTYKNGIGRLQFDRELTAIGGYAFASFMNGTLTSIKIPAKVSSITSNFMYGYPSNLSNIEVDENSDYFEKPIGSNCIIRKADNALIFGFDNAVIPSYVKKIIDLGFSSRTITGTLNIPEGVEEISGNSFQNANITSLSIPSTVNIIIGDAFNNANITNITVNSSNTTFNDGNGSNYLMKTSNDELLYLPPNNHIIPSNTKIIGVNACRKTTATTITVPEGVVEIKNDAFNLDISGNNLTTLVLPSTLTTIGRQAFMYCSKLNSITCYAETAPNIDSWTFYNCGQSVSGPKTLHYPAGSNYSSWLSNSSFYLGYYGWTGEQIGYVIQYTTTNNQPITISDSYFDASITSNTYSGGRGIILFDGPVTTIDSSAFKNQTTLSTIDFKGIPQLSTIGDSLFYGCTSLTEIKNLSELTTIPDYMFYNCSVLTTLYLPNGITSIGDYAYYENAFTSISIPNTVTSIGDYAFGNNSQCLKYNLAPLNSVPTLGTNGFDGIDSSAKILVKQELYNDFIIAPNWSDYINNIEISSYLKLSWIKSDHTKNQIINTGYIPQAEDKIEISVNIPASTISSGYHTLIGTRISNYRSNNWYLFCRFASNTWNYSRTKYEAYGAINWPYDQDIRVVMQNSIATMYNSNNEILDTINNQAAQITDCVNTLGLFGGNTASSGGWQGIDYTTFKFYRLRIWDSNNNLVRDYNPALDENNVPCIFDEVTEQYFYNLGSGTFDYA